MTRLQRKIDAFLLDWKKRSDHLPLIVKGARQIGKTDAIRHFAAENYENVIEINFALQSTFCDIFDNGFEVDTIIKNITMKKPDWIFIPGKTLIFFDELQDCVNCATSLKAFREDGRYDVICSGSMMGINYNEIQSNSVGNKEDYEMFSMDFEEFLWAKGYKASQLEDIYQKMLSITPLSTSEYVALLEAFRDYMVLGGMPAIVAKFVRQKNFSGTLQMQKQILLDYEEDITKYAHGLDKGKILAVYRKMPMFLGSDNKKFQISKVSRNARAREYVGVVEWLENAAIVNVCYALQDLALPLKGNTNPDNYKIYFRDKGLLIASLDDEAQEDLRLNQNFNTFKGAIYENVVADMLVKSGYSLAFYRNEKGTVELDFFVRDKSSLVPIEVKAENDSTPSLNKLIQNEKFPDIHYGIKLANRNIGFNGSFYTFPYFLTFLLKRFLHERVMFSLAERK